ncbi:hypothetical protein [Pseudomonas putida]|uniref:hypothetical protein n=1 Tax=Pseudomonas putida TaxID=303 RepID=UPI0009A19ED7|nr:hypothetical protein [Pseudomonas putida]
MKYVLSVLASFSLTYYMTGLLIRSQLAAIARGLRHRPDAPTPGEYLREVRPHARRARRQYTLLAGSVMTLLVCLLVSCFS